MLDENSTSYNDSSNQSSLSKVSNSKWYIKRATTTIQNIKKTWFSQGCYNDVTRLMEIRKVIDGLLPKLEKLVHMYEPSTFEMAQDKALQARTLHTPWMLNKNKKDSPNQPNKRKGKYMAFIKEDNGDNKANCSRDAKHEELCSLFLKRNMNISRRENVLYVLKRNI